eukprot:scaffold33816_cov98-Isochrysis_galbana.AAC.1
MPAASRRPPGGEVSERPTPPRPKRKEVSGEREGERGNEMGKRNWPIAAVTLSSNEQQRNSDCAMRQPCSMPPRHGCYLCWLLLASEALWHGSLVRRLAGVVATAVSGGPIIRSFGRSALPAARRPSIGRGRGGGGARHTSHISRVLVLVLAACMAASHLPIFRTNVVYVSPCGPCGLLLGCTVVHTPHMPPRYRRRSVAAGRSDPPLAARSPLGR